MFSVAMVDWISGWELIKYCCDGQGLWGSSC